MALWGVEDVALMALAVSAAAVALVGLLVLLTRRRSRRRPRDVQALPGRHLLGRAAARRVDPLHQENANQALQVWLAMRADQQSA